MATRQRNRYSRGRNEPKAHEPPERKGTSERNNKSVFRSHPLTSAWMSEVMNVLSKPAVAMALFIIGIGLVIMASKQLKLLIAFLERHGIYLRHNPTLSNFAAVSVFLVVWLDVLALLELKKMCSFVSRKFTAWYSLLTEVLDEMATKEQTKFESRKSK